MQGVIGAHGTLTGPNPGLGISADNLLEKLISKLKYEGLVSIVRRDKRRRMFIKKGTLCMKSWTWNKREGQFRTYK